jgi:hypothetical protein
MVARETAGWAEFGVQAARKTAVRTPAFITSECPIVSTQNYRGGRGTGSLAEHRRRMTVIVGISVNTNLPRYGVFTKFDAPNLLAR